MRKVTTMAGVAGLVFLVSSVVMVGCGGSSKKQAAQDMAGAGLDTLPPSDGGGDLASSGETCSTGTLFAGDPTYTGMDSPVSGTGVRTDPPLQAQNLVFSGSYLFTHVEGEIWVTDTSAANPSETLVAGKNDSSVSTFNYDPTGPCASVHYAQIRGMDVLSDGSLVVSDQTGNAIIHITNPTNPSTCTSEVWAGNQSPYPSLDPSASAPDSGTANGNGTAAQFNTPQALSVDASDNVYVWDLNNAKFRKIAAGASHTVTTLPALPADHPDQVWNLTHIGNTIFGVANTSVKAFVFKLDAGGNMVNIVAGTGELFPPLDEHTGTTITGITTDGTGLYIAGNSYVWYVTTSGTVTNVAGSGDDADFPDNGYDPTASHSAATLQLHAALPADTSLAQYYIGYHGGAVYFRGVGDGHATYVEKIACP